MSNVLLVLISLFVGILLYLGIAPRIRRALERRRDTESYDWGWSEGYDVGIAHAKEDPEEIRRDAYREGWSVGWDAAIEEMSQTVTKEPTPKPKRSRAKKIRKAEP